MSLEQMNHIKWFIVFCRKFTDNRWRKSHILRTTTDRLLTERPTSHSGQFRTAISRQRIIRYASSLILGRVFEVGGSNGHTSGGTKSKMAAGRHLEKFQMAISLHHLIDFVFDSMVGFSETADRMDLLPVVPNPRFGRPKISNDHISGMGYPMHFHELQSSFGRI